MSKPTGQELADQLLKKFEAPIAEHGEVFNQAGLNALAWTSIAISLKRIADFIEAEVERCKREEG